VRGPAAAALSVFVLAAAGCSSGTVGIVDKGADKAHGKQLFVEKCAACHTLAEANAQGKIGPNLDTSFRPDRKQGFDESTIREVVAGQILYPGNYGDTGPTMPPNLVTGDDVDAVAAYVAYVAGQKGKTVQASAPPAETTPSGSGGDANAAGKKAFTDNGCGACHTLAAAGASGKIGPDLDKSAAYAKDANMSLEDFIHESIVEPDKYVEKGYAKGIMPGTFGSLPKDTLDALVAFIAASAEG
jgi:cytochrome c2